MPLSRTTYPAVILFSILSLLCASCIPNSNTQPGRYFGPTDSIDQVIARINTNNSKIPTLWARHYFEATIVDPDQHKSHFINGDGVLLYRSPGEMRLLAHKEFTDLFELGTTSDQYWMKVVPELDTLWWGNVRNLGKPCAQPIPIQPNLIREVLGIGPIDTDLTRQPVPVLRFNNDVDQYMIVWSVRAPDRWLAQKEIWYDRSTLRPQRVLLFDDKGRVVLRAYLSNFARIHLDGVPAEQWPEMAMQFRLLFPDTGSKMSLTLSDAALTHNNVPRAGSIHLPDLQNSGVKKVIQIDADCGP